MPDISSWQTIRDRKLAEISSRFPKQWLVSPTQLPPSSTANVSRFPETKLGPLDIEITSFPTARSLLRSLQSRQYTALQVTTAFSKRAILAHQLTNCITEPLFDSALVRARFLDEHLRRTGQLYGPLHGLPISIKDCFEIAGVDSSIGIAALCFKPAQKNAAIVDILLAAGAVIHCKSNVPQTMLALDSTNNIFGRTLNPGNRQAWTAGGSSGGEGVLVAMRGAVMGVGTDVGGSVRIPAMCNGIVGFKPSGGRVPALGQQTGQLPLAGKIGMESSVGPIGRNCNDVGLFLETMERAEGWNTEAGMLPGKWWTGAGEPLEKGKKPLVGIIWEDGIVKPLPPVRRSLEECVERLRASGKVDVVEVEAERWRECQGLFNKFMGVEGGKHVLDIIASTGEPLIPWLDGRLKQKTPASVDTLRDLHAKRSELQNAFLKYWKDDQGRNIDAFVCPMAPHPVPPPDRWNALGYTGSWVLLDYPAASMPVDIVREADLKAEMEGEPTGSWDKINRGLWNEETIRREDYVGSSLGVQVVGQRLQERRLWDAMTLIEEILRDGKSRAKL